MAVLKVVERLIFDLPVIWPFVGGLKSVKSRVAGGGTPTQGVGKMLIIT